MFPTETPHPHRAYTVATRILAAVGRWVREGRNALRVGCPKLRYRFWRPVPGRFQAYSHTVDNRYPWLFQFAATMLGGGQALRILSFGCSRGAEVFSLRDYFPDAYIKGIDIDPRNIALCRARARAENAQRMCFIAAATTASEHSEAYDAIFCLAVLCLADLTISNARRSDPFLRFADFERMVADFSRCLKPGGLLLLHTTNFRFSDTDVARHFDVVLEADPSQLAMDVLFDRDNRLMRGMRYHAVAFRKREPTASAA
jgi:SAM-dependent methyltransferase